tara:strand:- start:12145 stop:13608 length:1464 start_codon:yes stop_codon:yes gene_type:complete
LNPLKKLFKQTFIYGLATVLPKMLSFFLTPLFVSVMQPDAYGEVSLIFSWFAIFNVLLAYGMETAFFRFYHDTAQPRKRVVTTSLLSIGGSSLLFLLLATIFRDPIATMTEIEPEYIQYAIYILVLDALVIIPFSWLRANGKPMRYALVKILNVAIYLGLNVFFLVVLPSMVKHDPDSAFTAIYRTDFEISYIFISNLIASAITLLFMLRLYFRRPYVFDVRLWKNMMGYAMPVLIAGIAFTVNEVFDRIMLSWMLPENTADSEIGKYSACYKLTLFMTLFATAFRMGIEPFFFSHSKTENPQRTYAQITNYFVILGSVILLTVVVFSDVLKHILIPNSDYWEAMYIVPLVVLGSFCLGIYHNLSVWYKITDRTEVGAYISIIGAILTIMINYTFIPYFGYTASAVATLVAYGSMMLLSFYFGNMYYPIPYNYRKIVFYLGISIGFSIVSFYVFNGNLIVGILLLLLFLGMLFKLEREQLKKIFLKK